jgi:hypothetical protein
MRILKIAAATLLSTSMMTWFSYRVSKKTGKQFREPQLLSLLIKRLIPEKSKLGNHADGWVVHYVAGLLFVLLYDQLWNNTGFKPTIKNGILLGALSGVFGGEVWRKVYQLHPRPPKNNFRQYYNQLVLAHIVFGLFAEIGYKVPDHLRIGEWMIPH